ncbi:hypothetical protein E4631_24015 [Hymenobacter sp. UV11]|uniref:hypothetical protein n=1 Tax=Hymenobacter sp. UV11 TaxID=1849735 RepID=UPI00105CB8EB|nr:hypothetical protein [Hymenobacter sp. UV11]TDN38615.1 hypothetical protein A8B98_22990 [Hymenobacter sp. UV11]TFZ62997.1 hypothetical protein E4631_24015 [Hymenobacter sp. UV11]
MQATDFTLAGDGDLLIENGDFVLSHSDGMHQEHILRSYTGFWRTAPLVGVGIEQYFGATVHPAEIKRAITLQIEADGYQIISLDVSFTPAFTIALDANRTR